MVTQIKSETGGGAGEVEAQNKTGFTRFWGRDCVMEAR